MTLITVDYAVSLIQTVYNAQDKMLVLSAKVISFILKKALVIYAHRQYKDAKAVPMLTLAPVAFKANTTLRKANA